MSEEKIQEALDFADSVKTSGIHLYDDIVTLAEAYRHKCEELEAVKTERAKFYEDYINMGSKYNRLLEVATGLHRSLCGYIDHDIRDDNWYDAEKQANLFFDFKGGINAV